MKNLMIKLTFIGLIGLLFSCKKDETKVVLLTDPIAPTIQTVPDLTLKRTSGNELLVIVGTPVKPGFQASATYYLEACPAGTNFADAITILSGVQDSLFKISVSNLNGILLKKFPADQVSSLDLRIRSVLTKDAGTGAQTMGYSSAIKTVNVTLYGLPRLDLINSGVTQKIESAMGDGKYSSYVKLDKTKAFTLKDPDTNVEYGGNGGTLAVKGTGILLATIDNNGWYKMDIDTKALTYSLKPFMIGIVGSATPNGWNNPDTKMDYDAPSGTWRITLDLQPSLDGGVMKSEFKFRINDGWNWNLGGTTDKLLVDAGNLVATPGKYTIVLTITNPNSIKGEVGGFCTITKN